MRRFLIIITLLLFIIPLSHAQSAKKEKRFNFGISVSANAPFVHERKMYVDWEEVNKPDDETNVAGSVSIFGRVNFKKHYLQLEAGNSFIRDVVTLDIKDFGYSTNQNIKTKNLAITFDLPLIYGYNFIKQDKYELSLFAGPKMRYTYLNREKIENPQDITFNIKEDVHPLTACCVVGIGAKISRVMFDFRYEFGITVHNKPGTYSLYENGALISEGTFYAKRSINLLSFSLGVIL
jgi:hypothetical protein